jgi:hypothetical protein
VSALRHRAFTPTQQANFPKRNKRVHKYLSKPGRVNGAARRK